MHSAEALRGPSSSPRLLSRPDGNATGVVVMATELGPKRLLRDLVPKATTITALVNPSSPNAEFELRNAQAAGRTVGAGIAAARLQRFRDGLVDLVINAAFKTFGHLEK